MTEHIQPPVDAGTICEICTMQDPGILTQPSRRVWIRTPEGLLRQMEVSDSRIPENSKPDGSSQKEGLNPGAGPETETDMDQDAGTGSGGERELPEPVAAAEETAETQGVGEHDSQPGSGESGYQTAADGSHPEISPGLTEDRDSSDDPATDTESKDGEDKTDPDAADKNVDAAGQGCADPAPAVSDDSQPERPGEKPADKDPDKKPAGSVQEKPTGCIQTPALLFPSAKPSELPKTEESGSGESRAPEGSAPVSGTVTGTGLQDPAVSASGSMEEKLRPILTAPTPVPEPIPAGAGETLIQPGTPGTDLTQPASASQIETGVDITVQTGLVIAREKNRERQGPEQSAESLKAESSGHLVKSGGLLFDWDQEEGLRILETRTPPVRFSVQETADTVQLRLPPEQTILSAQVDGEPIPVQKDEQGNNLLEVPRGRTVREVRALTSTGTLLEHQIGSSQSMNWFSLWPILLAPVLWLKRRHHG